MAGFTEASRALRTLDSPVVDPLQMHCVPGVDSVGLASLKGDTGEAGPAGTEGAPGRDGAQGPVGPIHLPHVNTVRMPWLHVLRHGSICRWQRSLLLHGLTFGARDLILRRLERMLTLKGMAPVHPMVVAMQKGILLLHPDMVPTQKGAILLRLVSIPMQGDFIR